MAENILKSGNSQDEKFTMKNSHDENILNEKVSPAIKRCFRSFRPLAGAIKKNRFHCGNDNGNLEGVMRINNFGGKGCNEARNTSGAFKPPLYLPLKGGDENTLSVFEVGVALKS